MHTCLDWAFLDFGGNQGNWIRWWYVKRREREMSWDEMKRSAPDLKSFEMMLILSELCTDYIMMIYLHVSSWASVFKFFYEEKYFFSVLLNFKFLAIRLVTDNWKSRLLSFEGSRVVQILKVSQLLDHTCIQILYWTLSLMGIFLGHHLPH